MEISVVFKMWAWAILRVSLGVYIGLCVLLFFTQAGMVYHPTTKIMFTPDILNLPYENVFFMSEDGERLSAWFVPADEARGVLLMCHGNGGNIGDRIYAMEFFNRLGMSVFIFDYRGYGLSSGRPSEEGTYKDVQAAWDFLVRDRGVPAESIIIHGRSLGGAIAAWLAERVVPAGLIVESAFTSIPDVGRKIYPYLPITLLCKYDYNALNYIASARCSVLVAHSPDDEMIPFEHGRKLFDAAPEPKFFFELSGSHNDGEGFFSDGYRNKLDVFFELVLIDRKK